MKRREVIGVIAGGALAAAVARAADEKPLLRAHAHNDYQHARPLLDALNCGFCSVEADIHLVNGRLLVAHERKEVKPERTLEALYLNPLRERARANRGFVYSQRAPFSLLVDVKSEAESTYAALRDALNPHASMLTIWRGEAADHKAVSVILSGNRARNTMEAETTRLAAFDGRLEDLDSPATALIPLISANWQLNFRWNGDGAMPDDERRKLRELAERAHRWQRRIRFWATPEKPQVWRALLEAGVDLINSDRLTELRDFLLARPQLTPPGTRTPSGTPIPGT